MKQSITTEAEARQCHHINRYATTDLEMKRKAIEQAQAIDHTTDDWAAL